MPLRAADTTAREAPAPLDRDALLGELASNDAAVRRAAALALSRHPGSAAALGARLVVDPDRAVQDAILEALVRVGDGDAVRALLPGLRTDDAAVRNGVVEALAAMPQGVGPFMPMLLADPDPDVRILALDVLQVLPDARANDWLAHVLAHDGHVNVCAAAVDRAAEMGGPDLVPLLRALCTRFPGEPFVAFAVRTAILRITGGAGR